MTGSELLEIIKLAKTAARKNNLNVRVGTRYVEWKDCVDYELCWSAPFMSLHEFLSIYGE